MGFDPKPILDSIPAKPGVYQFYDSGGAILYVGKAISLRNRVRQYFQTPDKQTSTRIKMMVRKIADIRYTVVGSDRDAWILENNLIKSLQPKYNVALKDDKTYPWICIKNEPFPRVFATRRKVNDGSFYFGPYPSGRVMRTLMDTIRDLYPLRTCTLNLSQQNIQAGKFRACLEFQIGNCLAPCEGRQSTGDYEDQIGSIKDILQGNFRQVEAWAEQKMKKAASDLRFEEAQKWKDRLGRFKEFQERSFLSEARAGDLEVYGLERNKLACVVHAMRVKEGRVIGSRNMELRPRLDESEGVLLALAIGRFRMEFFTEPARELVCQIKPEMPLEDLKLTIPQRGDKLKLLSLARRNARTWLTSREQQSAGIPRQISEVLDELRKALGMKELPRVIDCMDNSNLQGSNPVAALVRFKDTRPFKSGYRKFHIKTVQGPDDFESMREVVHRRFQRLTQEEEPFPDLLLIDGGKGQLSAAMEALKLLGLDGQFAVAGLAKRLEEIFLPGSSESVMLSRKSPALRYLQRIRDEAHRFGIGFHRDVRQKQTLRSALEEIPGLGRMGVQDLLQQFGSMKRVGEASIEELQEVIGKARGQKVYNHLHSGT